MPPTPLRIGFLHLGDPRGGVHRYGKLLADAMRRQPGVEVVERSADGAPFALAGAIAPLRRADVAVVQYSRHHTWAPGRVRLLQLLLTHLYLRRRSIVVLHDVSEPGTSGRVEEWALGLNLRMARHVVVHTTHERDRLAHRGPTRRVATIPHFVEARRLPDREAARHRFDARPDDMLLGMVGWIHARKNQRAAVETLALLGPSARLWLIGAAAADHEWYARELRRLADDLGVGDRFEITGYLSDDDLDARLAALDVGLCPYTDASASGSFATLIASGRPIVATDLQAFRDQQQHVGKRVRLVAQPTPERLATAVREVGAEANGRGADPPPELSPDAVARRYLELVR
ncbi:MAG TPA: glycosyltransferase family 4 protein [Solirubrobacteraceae bacterium]|jgi:glycosyltransferase involved in cell wall biosynthesis